MDSPGVVVLLWLPVLLAAIAASRGNRARFAILMILFTASACILYVALDILTHS